MPAPGETNRASRLDQELDAALIATFPASDPVATGGPTGTEAPARPVDRRAPLIDHAEVELASRPRQSRKRRA